LPSTLALFEDMVYLKVDLLAWVLQS